MATEDVRIQTQSCADKPITQWTRFLSLKKKHLKVNLSVQIGLPCSSLDLSFLFHRSLDEAEEIHNPIAPLSLFLSLSLFLYLTHTSRLAPAKPRTSVCILALAHIRRLSGEHRCLLLISLLKKKKENHTARNVLPTSASPAFHHLKPTSCKSGTMLKICRRCSTFKQYVQKGAKPLNA